MVTLEEFKKYMGHIQAQMAKDDVLTDVLIGEENNGWISTAAELIDDVIELIGLHIKGESTEDWISWWLWEVDHDKPEEERNNHVWIKDETDGQSYKYTIEDLDDLYHLIVDEHDAIKKRVQEEMPEVGIQPTVEHPNFTNETLYDVFMRSCGYTESDN